jgi:NADPH-dependent glutamate synthase beta subunit-like oxidoreductase
MRINMLESLSDNIVIDKDKCTYCGICVERCILDNLRMKLAPCRQACPLGVNCHGYVQTIARGEEEKGIELLRETLPFPGILGRICSQPCEDNCHRKKVEGAAVSIRALKRYLSDLERENEILLPDMGVDTGKKTAVIGSGPAGMMASYDLRVKGHQVTVFDAESEPGGMLRWAIPEFRLPLDILEQELDLLTHMGVRFQCNVAVGKDKSTDEIKDEFDALVIATGCPKHGTLNIKGEDSTDIFHGLPFLREVRSGNSPQIGKTAIVIGGGNVAVDAAQTALRLGAESVTMVTLESDQDLPAFRWAVESALAEGVKLECSWGNPTIQFEAGKLKGMDFQKCLQVFDECGCFMPSFDDCQLKTLDADTVIVAIGQGADTAPFESTGFVKDGSFFTDELTLQSADGKVFLAGDLVGGPSSVVAAMAKGRQAAESVNRYLTGEHLRFGRTYPGPIETEFDIDTDRGSEDRRAQISMHTCRGKGDFKEIELGLDKDTARKEAARCYSCGQPFGKYRHCWFCLPCEVDCPHEALWVEVPYLLR